LRTPHTTGKPNVTKNSTKIDSGINRKNKKRIALMETKIPEQIPPCINACPVHLNIPRYIRAISKGNFEEALAVIREKLPFPSVCGRICFHPCEDACNANHLLDKGPVAINALKRFVSEGLEFVTKESPPAQTTGKSVAIVGSGPAGLTAAYYLRRLGHRTVVFEMLSEPGGMVRFGIPDYRLPKDMLSREINAIKKSGVEIKLKSKVKKPGKLIQEGYNAVFVAIGAHETIKMGTEGEDLPGVLDCIALMKDLNKGKRVSLGKQVVVIGGGNAAIDAARSALRLGSKEVIIIYRRSLEEMPASKHEVQEALAEGVKIQFQAFPTKIENQNGKLKIHCIRTRLYDPDDGGRKRPVPISGTEFETTADRVISAIGQVPEIPAGFGIGTTQGKLFCPDPVSLATDQSGIFAGGDAVTGPASFIEAIAAGRQAAISIDKYLGGSGEIDIMPAPPEEKVVQTQLQGFPVSDRIHMATESIDKRLKDFSPVELGFDEEQARNEAKRCLQCDLPISINAKECTGCLTCVMRCSLRFEKSFSPAASKISVISYADEKVNEIFFSAGCDTCGICARYCPHDALYRGERKTETK
jgi:formate dehydrogenase beta subunit